MGAPDALEHAREGDEAWPMPELADDAASDGSLVGDGPCRADVDQDSESDADDIPVFLMSSAWKDAEAGCGLRPPDTPARAACGPSAAAPVPRGASCIIAKSFSGPIPGFVFTTRDSVTG